MRGTYPPVPCPRCGERQNRNPGELDIDREPFGPVLCMVCGHRFSREEYLSALAVARAQRPRPRPGPPGGRRG